MRLKLIPKLSYSTFTTAGSFIDAMKFYWASAKQYKHNSAAFCAIGPYWRKAKEAVRNSLRMLAGGGPMQALCAGTSHTGQG